MEKFEHALSLREEGKFKEAEELFLEIFDEDNECKEALIQLGKTNLISGNTEKAEEYFRDCIKRFDDYPQPYLQLAKLYIKQKRYSEAKKELDTYIEIDEDKSAHGHLVLGKLYEVQNQKKEAEEEYKKAIAIDGNKSPFGHLKLGTLYTYQRKLKKAEKEIRMCMDLEQDKSCYGRFQLGIIYLKRNEKQKAEEEFRKCLEIDGEDKYIRKRIKKFEKKRNYWSCFYG